MQKYSKASPQSRVQTPKQGPARKPGNRIYALVVVAALSLFSGGNIYGAATELPSGLVAWWRAENDARDSVGGRDGTLMNSAGFAGGEVGQGFNFNGNEQFVQVPGSDAWDFTAHDGTIDFWTRLTAMPPFVAGFINQINNDSNWAVYMYSDGRIEVGTAGRNGFSSPPGTITAGVWSHIAIAKSSAGTTLFVNGNKVAEGGNEVWTSTQNPLRMGGHVYGSPYYLNGVMDEIDVFNRALTAEEIQSIYQAGSAGKAQIVFRDNFDNGASPQWDNHSGNWVASGGNYNALDHITPNISSLPYILTDFSVDVDINDIGDGGIWLRTDSTGQNGILLITGGMGWGNGNPNGGQSLYWHVVQNGNYVALLNEVDGLFTPGVSDVHLHITAVGDTYAVYIDGSSAPATTLTDSHFQSGRVGLYDFSSQTFDNFVLRIPSSENPPAAPWITAPPRSQTVLPGQTVTLSVIALGTEPLHYQWRKNGQEIQTATDATLTLEKVQSADAGNYDVVVSNALGNITTQAAKIVVGDGTVTSETVTVPGWANPWLADMPDGTTARKIDSAPAQSPVLVPSQVVIPGNQLRFQVQGGASHGPSFPITVPDGDLTLTLGHLFDAEHGIGGLSAPVNSLVGVFLNDTQPDRTGAPTRLDFSSLEARDYAILRPLLKQPFFIGDGRTSAGGEQVLIVPPEATRLFLGSMDAFDWNNNRGSFQVILTSTPVSQVKPSITTQPQSQTVLAGQSVTLSVVASGTEPLRYQWRKDQVEIPGATSATLTIENAQSADAGAYDVVVSNSAGSVISDVATLTVNTKRPIPSPSGLVAWWRAEGDATDSVGGHSGTLMNGAGFAGGEVGQGFNFNGSGQFLQVPASPVWDFTAHDGTIDFWTRLTAMPPFVAGFINQINNDSNWALYMYWDGRLEVGTAGRNGFSSPPGTITAGVWLHIAIAKSSTGTKLFVNGSKVAEGGNEVWTSTQNPLRIGGHEYGSPYYLNGVMDEIDVFNRALTAEEIQSIYRAGSAGKAQILLSIQSGVGVTLKVAVRVGTHVVADRSGDLVHWTNVTDKISTESLFTIIDPTATSEPFRFYRFNLGLP